MAENEFHPQLTYDPRVGAQGEEWAVGPDIREASVRDDPGLLQTHAGRGDRLENHVVITTFPHCAQSESTGRRIDVFTRCCVERTR